MRPGVRSQYTITLDDDPTMKLIIEQSTGMASLPFTQVETLLARADRYAPLALFVDIHLETASGLDAIRPLREIWTCPIIVMTADDASELISQALAAGAHDFVRKPLRKPELLARLAARMSEAAALQQRSEIILGDLTYSKKWRQLEKGGLIRGLAPYEALVLEALLETRGILLSRDSLKSKVWGKVKVSDSALDKKIFNLRQTLREMNSEVRIDSEYGKGLCLKIAAETK